jgi:hypothetical protein
MTMAAAIEDRTADADGWSKASRIAAIDIIHDSRAAEGIWRSWKARKPPSRRISGSTSSVPGNGRSASAKVSFPSS